MNYPTISLLTVINAIHRARGFDATSVTITTAEQQQYADIINQAGQRAWRAELWPCLMSVGIRQYRPTWDASYTYALNHEVYYGGIYYRSLVAINLGNTPGTDATKWSASPSDFIPFIAFEQSWETDVIDAVHFPTCATSENPLTTPNARVVQGVTQWERNILFSLVSDAPARPYIRYRTPWPKQTAVAWAAGTPYAVGDRVYSGGYTYVAIAATTGNTPGESGSAAYWAVVGFPEMFLEYVRLYAKSEFSADDEGKYKSRAEAEAELDTLREFHLPQSGQPGRVRWRGR